MAKDNKKEKQKKDKMKRLFQNSVGVTASAAVVVVATPLFDNVDAQFNELKLLEDSIYYELEVIENVSEEGTPNGYPLRLIIENQWERIEVDLDYGITGNVIENLRPNAQYTFTIEMDKGLTWVTLLNERVKTENELAGVIGLTSVLDNEERNVSVNIFTQSGGIPISFYFLELYENNELIQTLNIIEGDQVIDTKLTIANHSYEWVLKGVSDTGQLYTLDSKVFVPEAVFDFDADIFLMSLNEVMVQNAIPDDFFEATYTLLIKENNTLIQEETLTGEDILLSLTPGSTYEFEIFITYFDERVSEMYTKRLYTKTIEFPEEVFFVVNEIISDEDTLYLLNLENFDDQFEDAYIQIRNARTGRVSFERRFRRVSDRFTTSLFEYQLDRELESNEELVIGVILKDTDIYVPLYIKTP